MIPFIKTSCQLINWYILGNRLNHKIWASVNYNAERKSHIECMKEILWSIPQSGHVSSSSQQRMCSGGSDWARYDTVIRRLAKRWNQRGLPSSRVTGVNYSWSLHCDSFRSPVHCSIVSCVCLIIVFLVQSVVLNFRQSLLQRKLTTPRY